MEGERPFLPERRSSYMDSINSCPFFQFPEEPEKHPNEVVKNEELTSISAISRCSWSLVVGVLIVTGIVNQFLRLGWNEDDEWSFFGREILVQSIRSSQTVYSYTQWNWPYEETRRETELSPLPNLLNFKSHIFMYDLSLNQFLIWSFSLSCFKLEFIYYY